MNQDGKSNGLTAPNPAAQERVLRAAYADAGVSPGEVQYVECHGTGTALGDAIEARGLRAVVGAGRAEPTDRCLIGSVKTNLGHLEAAAGITGFIKTALAVHHGLIPPSLHFSEPNPHVDFEVAGLLVATTVTPWPAPTGRRRAGVSSFGFGGTNVHCVLGDVADQPADSVSPGAGGDTGTSRRLVLPVSSPTVPQLDRLVEAWLERLDEPDVDVPSVAATAALRRTHHPHRLAAAGRDAGELRTALRASRAAAGSSARPGRSGARVAFCFTGQGSQFPGMMADLLAAEPIVSSTFRRCDEIVRACARWSLFDVLTGGDDTTVSDTRFAQPLLVASHVALAALWRSYGVHPVAVFGHSIGEISASPSPAPSPSTPP
jgi:acyl transferase domain-containing protein